MGDVISEKDKVFFKKGDSVKLKGEDVNSPTLKVEGIEWEKDEEGNLIKENGKKKINGVLCSWFTTIEMNGTEINHEYVKGVFDSRSLYKVEHTLYYYLMEAKKKAYEEGNMEVVKKVDEAISYSNLKPKK